jgi:hypothetical protein
MNFIEIVFTIETGLAAATQPQTDPTYKYQSDLFMSPYHHGAKLSSFMSPHHSMTSSSGKIQVSKYIPKLSTSFTNHITVGKTTGFANFAIFGRA